MNDTFGTTMSAEIKIPQAGFTVEDLKAHMRATKVPLTARLIPAIVGNALGPDDNDEEVRFRAEWSIE